MIELRWAIKEDNHVKEGRFAANPNPRKVTSRVKTLQYRNKIDTGMSEEYQRDYPEYTEWEDVPEVLIR